MDFTNYTIYPKFNSVIIDGEEAQGVSMAGIPPNVNSIVWTGLKETGVIEYAPNPVTGEPIPPETFTNKDEYYDQTSEAEAIIYARNNPVTYYSTISNNVYDGKTYGLSVPIVINTPNTPQPPHTTADVPLTPASWQALYWYNNAWVVSSVDPTLSLSVAKTALITTVNVSAAYRAAQQARVYSSVQQINAPDINALATADYPNLTLGQYQTYVDGRVSVKTAEINSAESVSQLYDFDPIIPEYSV